MAQRHAQGSITVIKFDDGRVIESLGHPQVEAFLLQRARQMGCAFTYMDPKDWKVKEIKAMDLTSGKCGLKKDKAL